MAFPAPTLSICIPTYNFGALIGETLDSILAQVGEGVDIVVVDGASTDDTAAVVAARRTPRLAYHRLPAKGGIDTDMAASVELCTGDYCWLFSADDIMYAGAVAAVLEQLRDGSDLYLTTHSNSTFDLTPLSLRRPALRFPVATTLQLGDPAQRRTYFENALTTEAFFSFMGTLIVRREKWRSMAPNTEYYGTCWAHAARLLAMARDELAITYLPTPLLTRRGGNDSFLTHGIVKRYALAVDGYHRIADRVFGAATVEAKHIKRVVRAEFTVPAFVRAKRACADAPAREDRKELDRLASKTFLDGSPRGYVQNLAYRAIPAGSASMAYNAYQWVRGRRQVS